MVIGEKFTIKRSQIPSQIFDSAEFEAKSIFESKYTSNKSLTNRLRTYEEVKKDTLLGHLGEYFIKTNFNYSNDPEKWHDLISPDGERTEIKTWRKHTLTEENKTREIERIKKRKNVEKQWFFSTKLIIILYDVEKNEFEIEGLYDI